MENSERGMDPTAFTMINPRTEYWPSQGFEPASSSSQVFHVTTELQGLGKTLRKMASENTANQRKPLMITILMMTDYHVHLTISQTYQFFMCQSSENSVENGEIAHHEQFLPFPH